MSVTICVMPGNSFHLPFSCHEHDEINSSSLSFDERLFYVSVTIDYRYLSYKFKCLQSPPFSNQLTVPYER